MCAFWRVEYEGEIDKALMLQRKQLAWPRGVSIADRRKLGKQMRLGDGVVWGKLRGSRGMIDGIGRIVAIEPHDIKGYEIGVVWQELPPLYVVPESRGVSKWKKFPVFKFADAPAKRYKLEKLLTEQLGVYAGPLGSNTSIAQPVYDLIQAALSTIPKPYPTNITDLVCLAIENNDGWLKQYEALVTSCKHMVDGKGFVNSQIGWEVRRSLGFVNIGEGNKAQSKLIKSFSSLAPPSNFWQRITALEGNTLQTLDQRNPFTISEVTEGGIRIMVESTEKERPIKRAEIEGTWQELLTALALPLMTIKASHSEWSPVYIAAMLAEMPGVSVEIRPIVLRYQNTPLKTE